MNTIKKVLWVIAIITWMFSLIILVVALTDLFPDNSFKEYRLIIGMGFITVTGFIRIAYKKHRKQQQSH